MYSLSEKIKISNKISRKCPRILNKRKGTIGYGSKRIFQRILENVLKIITEHKYLWHAATILPR